MRFSKLIMTAADKMKEIIKRGSVRSVISLSEARKHGKVLNIDRINFCERPDLVKDDRLWSVCWRDMAELEDYLVDCSEEIYSDEVYKTKSAAMMRMDLVLWEKRAVAKAGKAGFHAACVRRHIRLIMGWVSQRLLKRFPRGLELEVFK